MDPTCGLGEKLRDIVLNVIWEHLLYLICYGQNVEKLNEELVRLTIERRSLQHRIDEARNNVEQIDDKVLHWLDEVHKISEQVEQLHKESQSKRECTITSCPNPWLRYKLSKRAKAMAQEVADIKGRANFPIVAFRVPPQPMLELPIGVNNEGIDSRVHIMNQLMGALQNPSVKMVGLCGIGGVGKTTIAKEVGRNQNMFDKVIMATVSQELNIEKIQSQIAEKLGMELKETIKETRASRLCERLQNEGNMLLILDDLWVGLDLAKVGIPFVDVEKCSQKNEGCKILLTSRDETVLLNGMKCQKIIKVGVLSKDEAWELFKRVAELSNESCSSDLESIAIEIVQRCEGLPLAIATAAKALKDQKIDGWEDYLTRMKHPLTRSFTGIKEVDTILRLSYDHLSLENKHIFLIAAMLSHDPSIEDLLMYSVGLDILKHADNMEKAHKGISTVVRKLKSLNLFLDSSFSSNSHFTIHDVFRDVALSIASDELLHAFIVRHTSLDEWPDKNQLEGCRGFFLQESDITHLPEEFHGQALEFFLLISKKVDLAIPNMFFKSSNKLKLLAFTNVHFSSLPSLKFLQKLRALCLHTCVLEDISEVGSLRKLKVLSLAHSEIEQLPIELAELTSLQRLNLSHCSKLKVIPQKLLSNLKKLEGLFMGNSFNQWKVEESNEADENASLDELMDLPQISSLDIHIPDVSMLPKNLFLDMKLKRYKIFIGTHWKWQDHFECSKILKLDLESSTHLTGGIPKLFEGVESLHLYGPNALESVLHSYHGRGFPYLRNLHVKSNTSNIISGSLFNNKVLLPKVEILKLSNLNGLISLIWDYQISLNSFNNLKKLIVERCGIVKLVPFHVLKFLNNLEEVEVQNCDMLETMFDFEDLNDYEIVPSSVVVPLKKLKLWGLPKLKNVWSNHYCRGNVSFLSLRSVDVGFCESLTSIFPASIAEDVLRDLEELSIEYCGIDVIVAKDLVSESVAVKFEFPKLTSLRLAHLSKLRSFYPHKHTLELSHLQELSIECCDELEIFEKEVSSSSGTQEEETTIDSMYPLLSHEKVVRTLERLILRGKQVEMIGSGQFQMYHSPKLKQLCLSVLKSEHFLVIPSDLGWLQLSGDFEEALGGDNVAALVAPFSKLEVDHVSKLSPSLVSSSTLTHLSVKRCYGLTTLMTSSIARSLTHLMHLSVGYCKEMEEIITMQEGEDDEDKEIIFNKLKFLELRSLPKLKRFCAHCYTFKFSLLDQLIIEECPKFIIFSPGVIDTPYLISVQPWQDRGKIWDSDLNKIVYQQFFASREVVLDEHDCRIIRNDQFQGDNYPQVEILRIERFVDEGVTFPYTLLERFMKLNALHVQKCSFEEIFPSHTDIADKILAFKELCLAKLDQLKNIFPSSTSFDNLTVLKVSKCHRLACLMTNSTAKNLMILETLEIEDCKKLEEIVAEETNDSMLPSIFQKLKFFQITSCSLIKLAPSSASFDSLTTLKVSKCHQLAYLMTNSTAKSMVNLETLEIENCEKLEEIVEEETNDLKLPPIYQKLKFFQVKSCSLIKLAPSSASFDSLTTLKVSKCHHLMYLVTNSTAKSMVNLETLEMDDCEKLKEIVNKNTNEDVEGEIRTLELTHLRTLKTTDDRKDINTEDRAASTGCTNISTSLYNHNKVLLPKLEILELSNLSNNLISLIWDDQLLHKSLSNLKTLIVERCDFMKFVPLHVLNSLNNLEKMKVNGCDNLEMVFGYHKEMESSSAAMPLNLKHLEVKWCRGLTTLMASSATQGLVHLAHLSVSNCNKIKEIITKDEGGDDEDKEILFTEMKFLKLDSLPRLKRFCGHGCTLKFPLLNQLIMARCPKFKIFSLGLVDTPFLKSIQLSKDSGEHIEIWDTNLNKAFYQQRFVKSKELVLDEDDAIMIRNDKFPEDCCPQVEILGIEGFVDEWVTFPHALLERFPRLNELHVKDCSFGEIFASHAHIFYDSQLPRIQTLKILRVVNCCNLIKLAPSSTSFYNLTELKVSKCHQIVYLVTNLTAKSLVNLDTLEIHDCEKMEEIVCKEINEDVEGEITFKELRKLKLSDLPRLKAQEDKRDFSIEYKAKNNGRRNIFGSLFSHNKVFLPKLEMLKLSHLSNKLISLIWDDQLLHNSFSNLKRLIMKSCNSMKSVPLPVLKSLNNLKNLEIRSCDKLEKVFGYEDLNDYYKEKESSSVVVPLNLTHLEVEWCRGLTTLMTSSAARSLVHLTHLSVSVCNQIEEIITKEEGGDDEDKEILFTETEFLKLHSLQRLKSFCCYNYTFKFPILEHVTISECPQLTMFCLGDIFAPRLRNVLVHEYHHEYIWKTNLNNTIQHLFTFQEVISTTRSMVLNAKNITTVMDVFPEVIFLYVESFKVEGVTFPYRSLERFPDMKWLYVEHSSFEEIFPSQEEIIAFEGRIPRLQRLYIAYLDKLKSIWKDDFQLPPIHQNLQYLGVKSCCNLAKLAPSSASFEYLLQLSISGCHQLIYLVTISTAKSLVSLIRLEIHDCKKMEEIVMNDTNEDVEGAITFKKLRKIELTETPSLKMFSSQNHSFEFPELEEIKFTGCPNIKMVCPGVLETPKMSKVKIEEHDIKWEDERDLNKIIQRLSLETDSVNM